MQIRPLIDAHCHIYPDSIAEKAAAHIGSFYNAPMRYDGSLGVMRSLMRPAGITRALISSVATTPHQVSRINRFLAEAARTDPAHINALGTLHPDSADLRADFAELRALGHVGVKLHPDFLGIPVDDIRFLRIFELCEGVLPVCCHLGDARYDNTNPNRAKNVLTRFPALVLAGAHFAGYTVWDRVEAECLYAYPNLYADCSSSLGLIPREQALRLIRAYGASRVMFGSDFPMWSPAGEAARLDALDLSEAELEQIRYRTASAVYGVDAGAMWSQA